MSKLSFEVTKVLDVQSSQLQPWVLTWIEDDLKPEYRDTDLKENLFSASEVREMEVPEEVFPQMEEILAGCVKHKAAYFRITYI